MDGSRVFVTGMGCVSAAGLGADRLWHAARGGHSCVSRVEFDRAWRNKVKIAARLEEFDPESYIEPGQLIFCDRFTQFAVAAADEAMVQAGFEPRQRLDDRTAVIIGTGIGGATTIDDKHYEMYYVREGRPDPTVVPRTMPNAATSHVSMRYGCKGPSFAISSACSSATQAIGLGAWFIRSGMVERAIVGGSEALITPSIFRAWEALRVLAPQACRPFSKGRNGMVLGEGAGVFVLESERSVERRNAEPLIELVGYGTTSDAGDIVRPDVNGAAGAMQDALRDAGIEAGSVDYVNAHGTGTVMNDMVETEALSKVFGAHLAALPVSSSKPIHGHGLGAAGALELVVTIMSVRDNFVPPTINWLEPDPKCLQDPVANIGRDGNIDIAMSNSFAFGGINAVLIVQSAR